MDIARLLYRKARRRIDRAKRNVVVHRDGRYYAFQDGEFIWHLPNDDIDTFFKCKNFLDKYDRYIYRLSLGDTLLKVGPATGEDVIPAAKRIGDDGSVYAIEADPDNVVCLRKNLDAHGIKNTRVDQYAVSDESDKDIDFSKHGSSHTTHRVSDAPLIRNEDEYSSISLPTITVDDYCTEHEITHLDMLNVTVNRYEAAILRGASEMLGRTRYVVIPENENEFGDARAVLEASGFECRVEGHGGSLFENTSV